MAASNDDPDPALPEDHSRNRVLSLPVRYLPMRRWFGRGALAIVALVNVHLAGSAWAAGQKQVLVLYSTRRDAQIAIVGDRELPRVLEAGGLPEGLDFYSEYIDQTRFPNAQYLTTFHDY